MIKKFLLGLGITFLSFIGFSSAIDLTYVYQNGSYYSMGDNIDVAVYNRGMLSSNRLGNIKRMIAFASNVTSTTKARKYFWWNNGKAYFYYYYTNSSVSTKKSGYFTRYYLCDSITSSSVTSTTNCTQDEWGDGSFASAFFNSITVNDYWGYRNQANSSANFNICFSSFSYGKSICFQALNDSTSFYTSVEMSGNIDYIDFPNSLLGDPPGRSTSGGGNIDGSSGVGENTTLTGNVMYNTGCTNGYIVAQVSSEYGGINNVCYAGTYDTGIIDGGVTFVSVATGLDFKYVYNSTKDGTYGYFSSYSDWFNSWSDAFYRWRLGQLNAFPFNGTPTYLYTYFSRLYNNGNIYPGNSSEAFRIANFCKLALYSNYSDTYNGSYFGEYCSQLNFYSNNGGSVTTGEVGNIDDDEEILPPGYDVGGGSNTSSGVIVSVDWSGTLTGDTNKNFDGKTFINDFYQKLQANYQKPTNDLTGIVPVYIYVFLIALILFRFLSH